VTSEPERGEPPGAKVVLERRRTAGAERTDPLPTSYYMAIAVSAAVERAVIARERSDRRLWLCWLVSIVSCSLVVTEFDSSSTGLVGVDEVAASYVHLAAVCARLLACSAAICILDELVTVSAREVRRRRGLR
jgi:hypothetical protein